MKPPAQVSGQIFKIDDPRRLDLAIHIRDLVNKWADGKLIEINESGEHITTSYRDIFSQSENILTSIGKQLPKRSIPIVLFFARLHDFVAAAWACVQGGYEWIPWYYDSQPQHFFIYKKGLEKLGGDLQERFGETIFLVCQETESQLKERNIGVAQIQCINIYSSRHENTHKHTYKHRNDNNQEHHRQGCYITTSGTTAEMKLTYLSQKELGHRFSVDLKALKYPSSLILLPASGINACRLVIPPTKQLVHIHPKRLVQYPNEVLELVERYSINSFGLSAYLARLILNVVNRVNPKTDLSSLKNITFGADFIPPKLVSQFVTQLKSYKTSSFNISYVYGMTECGPITRKIIPDTGLVDYGNCPNTQKPTLEISGRIDSYDSDFSQLARLGKVMPGWHIRIVNHKGEVLPEEERGHIEVWSENKLFSGYFGLEHLKTQIFCLDGWFRTGDLGYLHKQELTITGRDANKLMVGASNLSLQQIELYLGALPELLNYSLVVLPVRTEGALSDQIVIILSSLDRVHTSNESLKQTITNAVNNNFNVSLKEIVLIQEQEFERTATGKIIRSSMLEKYLAGKYKTEAISEDGKAFSELENPICEIGNTATNNTAHSPFNHSYLNTFLHQIWEEKLNIKLPFSQDSHLFQQGGDSLSLIAIVVEIEKIFYFKFPITQFYAKPTLKHLQTIVNREVSKRDTHSVYENKQNHSSTYLIENVLSFTHCWSGERLYPQSLIVGHHTRGNKTPLFWVFQNESELIALAQQLGSDQPVYGMRSLDKVYLMRDYTPQNIQQLVDRYLWEILALPIKRPFFLGGNCQGAIIALQIAKMLKSCGINLPLLFLMEWNFSFGQYTDPVLFLFGQNSHTADIYVGNNLEKCPYKIDFPSHEIAEIRGSHGDFFSPHKISYLGNKISEYMQRYEINVP